MHWIGSLFALIGCGTIEHDVDPATASGDAGGGSSASAGSHAPGAPPHAGTGGSHAGSGQSGAGGTAQHAAGAGGNVAPPPRGDAGMDDGPPVGGEPPVDVPDPVSYPPLEATQLGEAVRVVTGYDLSESPLWDPCSERLLFTDVTASVIHALEADDTVTDFMTDTANTNGIAFDVDGSLILAQMGMGGHVARRNSDGTLEQLDPADSALHTPDDVIVRSDGTIYFSDGDFAPIGTLLGAYSVLPVYAIDPGQSALREIGRVAGPNGIELSPDERTLYVSAWADGAIVPFAIADDGSLTEGFPLIVGLTRSDSFCLDAAGNLYLGTGGGLSVFRPDGTPVGVIPIPAASTRGTTNCTFGGADGTTLYATNWASLYRIEGMPIPGLDWQVNQTRLDCNGN